MGCGDGGSALVWRSRNRGWDCWTFFHGLWGWRQCSSLALEELGMGLLGFALRSRG
jgi:hypothetical protein